MDPYLELFLTQAEKSISFTNKLKDASHELSNRYREQDQTLLLKEDREAYLIARLPATLAVLKHVLAILAAKIDPNEVLSYVDLGAAFGASIFPMYELFPKLQSVTLIERDPIFYEMGKKLVKCTKHPLLSVIDWKKEDFTKANIDKVDLALFSYSIGEIDQKLALSLLDDIIPQTKKFLVIIEPGTPAGFTRIEKIRDYLITKGLHMVAPCPHMRKCPMENGDWCHFFKRVERSSLHRKIKQGEKGYEDEKFSYLVFSKKPAPLPAARVLRHIEKRKGHMYMTLCGQDGLEKKIISKKDKNVFKVVKKLKWGDEFN